MSLSCSSRPGLCALLASFALAATVVACSSDEGGGDLTDAAAADTATSSSDAGGGTDTSTPAVDSGGTADATTASDGGIGYLEQCTTVGNPGDCAPGFQCKLFKGKAKNFCTKPCTGPADCPAPAKGCGGDNFCSPP